MKITVAASTPKYRIWRACFSGSVDKPVTNVIASGDISEILSTTLGILIFGLTGADGCTKVSFSSEETPSSTNNPGTTEAACRRGTAIRIVGVWGKRVHVARDTVCSESGGQLPPGGKP